MPVSDKVAMLSDVQPELSVELPIKQLGKYVLLISYVTESSNSHPLEVKVQAKVSIDGSETGRATLPSCPHTWLCR